MEDRYISLSFFHSTFPVRMKAGFRTGGRLFRLILLEGKEKYEQFTKPGMNACTFDISVSGTEAEFRVPAG